MLRPTLEADLLRVCFYVVHWHIVARQKLCHGTTFNIPEEYLAKPAKADHVTGSPWQAGLDA